MFEGVDLVSTVSTMYSDPADPRFEIALDTAERYQQAGIPLVVVDGSGPDNKWVNAALEKRQAVVLQAAVAGIATQRQQGVAFAISNGAEKVIGHEPEKNLMVTFAPEISAALDDYDVLVVARTPSAENSLPPVQQRTERLAGWILQRILGLPSDSLSGGRGFTAAGAECLATYPANDEGMNNWLYLYDVVLEARARNLPTGGLAVDLIHPQAMTDQETDDPIFDAKRYEQFRLQLNYLLRRSDIKPEALNIAQSVLGRLDQLPESLTNADYEVCIDVLETDLAKTGYEPQVIE